MDEVSQVFRGTVLEKRLLSQRVEMKGRRRYAITFRVNEYWKGVPGRNVILYGMDDGTDCLGGSFYEIGKNYLVYSSEVAVKDVIVGELFWYGWTDVLPEGGRMLVPAACTPGGETSTVRRALLELGQGRIPGSTSPSP